MCCVVLFAFWLICFSCKIRRRRLQQFEDLKIDNLYHDDLRIFNADRRLGSTDRKIPSLFILWWPRGPKWSNDPRSKAKYEFNFNLDYFSTSKEPFILVIMFQLFRTKNDHVKACQIFTCE